MKSASNQFTWSSETQTLTKKTRTKPLDCNKTYLWGLKIQKGNPDIFLPSVSLQLILQVIHWPEGIFSELGTIAISPFKENSECFFTRLEQWLN